MFHFQKKRFVIFLTLCLPESTHSSQCATKVASCPRSDDEVTERKRKYNCSSLSFYTCLPDENYNFLERCSPAFHILNGTGGCPYIEKCDKELGFIYGNTFHFKPCPENKTGCPPVYHSSYKIQDLYKYPACFYKDGNILLVNMMALKDHNQQFTQITTETTSAVSSENQIISQYPQTALILLAVFLSLSMVTSIFFVTYYTVRRRKRKKSRKKEEPIVATVTYLEERVPLSSQEPSVMEFKDDVCKPIIHANHIRSTNYTGSSDSGDDACKPIIHANLIPSTNNTGSSDSGVDVRVRANLSLDKDFSNTSQECTEKLHSESNLNIKGTSVEDHQGRVIYKPISKTEESRIENVQRQHQP